MAATVRGFDMIGPSLCGWGSFRGTCGRIITERGASCSRGLRPPPLHPMFTDLVALAGLGAPTAAVAPVSARRPRARVDQRPPEAP